MKKTLFFLLVFLSLVTSACGTKQQSDGDYQETIPYEYKENGLALKATIMMGENIKVDASITNVSGETIIYNGRCGIPFGIGVKKEDAFVDLVIKNGKETACTDVFDPDDLREMKPNETFDKEIVFKRQLKLSNQRTISALSGTYDLYFSFNAYKHGDLSTFMPIELTNDKDPEILTVDQAREKAKENKEVDKWVKEHEQKGMTIEAEDAILNEGEWTVSFHAIHEDTADRIVITMDAKTGEIKAIHYDKVPKEFLEK